MPTSLMTRNVIVQRLLPGTVIGLLYWRRQPYSLSCYRINVNEAIALFYFCVTAGRGGFSSARFFEAVAQHKVASRNTADAFIKEMLHYNYVRYIEGAADRRTRPLEPTETSIEADPWLARDPSRDPRQARGR